MQFFNVLCASLVSGSKTMKSTSIQLVLLGLIGAFLITSCGKGSDESLANPLDTAIQAGTSGNGNHDKGKQDPGPAGQTGKAVKTKKGKGPKAPKPSPSP